VHSFAKSSGQPPLAMFALFRSARQAKYGLSLNIASIVRRMSTPSLPPPPDLKFLATPEDNQKARGWLNTFKERQIPKELVAMSFSRSSGPGGQVGSGFVYSCCDVC
jgi:hypothetical protein